MAELKIKTTGDVSCFTCDCSGGTCPDASACTTDPFYLCVSGWEGACAVYNGNYTLTREVRSGNAVWVVSGTGDLYLLSCNQHPTPDGWAITWNFSGLTGADRVDMTFPFSNCPTTGTYMLGNNCGGASFTVTFVLRTTTCP